MQFNDTKDATQKSTYFLSRFLKIRFLSIVEAPDDEKPSKITLVGHLFSTNFFSIDI